MGRLGCPFPELPEADGRGVNWCHPSLLRFCATVSCAGRFTGAWFTGPADPRFIGAGAEFCGRVAEAEDDGLENVCHPPAFLAELFSGRAAGPASFLLPPAFGCRAGIGCEPLPRTSPPVDEVGGRGVPNRCHPELDGAGRPLFASADPRWFALIPRFSAAGLFAGPRFGCVPVRSLFTGGRVFDTAPAPWLP